MIVVVFVVFVWGWRRFGNGRGLSQSFQNHGNLKRKGVNKMLIFHHQVFFCFSWFHRVD